MLYIYMVKLTKKQEEIEKAIELINNQDDDVYRVLRGLQYRAKQSFKDSIENVIQTLAGEEFQYMEDTKPNPVEAIKMLEKIKEAKY